MAIKPCAENTEYRNGGIIRCEPMFGYPQTSKYIPQHMYEDILNNQELMYNPLCCMINVIIRYPVAAFMEENFPFLSNPTALRSFSNKECQTCMLLDAALRKPGISRFTFCMNSNDLIFIQSNTYLEYFTYVYNITRYFETLYVVLAVLPEPLLRSPQMHTLKLVLEKTVLKIRAILGGNDLAPEEYKELCRYIVENISVNNQDPYFITNFTNKLTPIDVRTRQIIDIMAALYQCAAFLDKTEMDLISSLPLQSLLNNKTTDVLHVLYTNKERIRHYNPDIIYNNGITHDYKNKYSEFGDVETLYSSDMYQLSIADICTNVHILEKCNANDSFCPGTSGEVEYFVYTPIHSVLSMDKVGEVDITIGHLSTYNVCGEKLPAGANAPRPTEHKEAHYNAIIAVMSARKLRQNAMLNTKVIGVPLQLIIDTLHLSQEAKKEFLRCLERHQKNISKYIKNNDSDYGRGCLHYAKTEGIITPYSECSDTDFVFLSIDRLSTALLLLEQYLRHSHSDTDTDTCEFTKRLINNIRISASAMLLTSAGYHQLGVVRNVPRTDKNIFIQNNLVLFGHISSLANALCDENSYVPSALVDKDKNSALHEMVSSLYMEAERAYYAHGDKLHCMFTMRLNVLRVMGASPPDIELFRKCFLHGHTCSTSVHPILTRDKNLVYNKAVTICTLLSPGYVAMFSKEDICKCVGLLLSSVQEKDNALLYTVVKAIADNAMEGFRLYPTQNGVTFSSVDVLRNLAFRLSEYGPRLELERIHKANMTINATPESIVKCLAPEIDNSRIYND